MNTDLSDTEELRILMMAVLDGEADAAAQDRLHAALAADPALREDFNAMQAIKELTVKNKPPAPSAAVWETYWMGVYNRLERGVGWILFSLGAVALLLFGAWHVTHAWLTDPQIPLWVRGAGVMLVTGTIILLASVAREKWFLHRNERYRDIQR